MTEKKTLCIFFVLLLLANVTLVSIPSVHAQLPIISLSPSEITIPAPGQNFTVAVNVTDITNMKGFAFKLDYNTTILNATIVSSTSISDDTTKWLPVDANLTFHWDAPPTINDTMGRVWVAAWGFTAFTGNGSVLTINFTATAAGNSSLHLYETEHLDNFADPIDHTALDGEVAVIPEFPTALLMPLLVMATLAATFLGKMIWSRKRKDALVTK